MHVAGYGPKALAVGGRQGDGIIIQLADPDIIQWIMDTARAAAEEAGRDPAALKCIVSAPSHVTDDLQDAREQVRWFPAMVSNHVQDLIDRYGTDGSSVPQALTDYVQARKFYDYNEHSRVGAKHGEFVTDEICDRFCVIGNTEQCTAKLRELEAIGVDQFNIYLMTHGQEETLQAYGDDIIPRVRRRSLRRASQGRIRVFPHGGRRPASVALAAMNSNGNSRQRDRRHPPLRRGRGGRRRPARRLARRRSRASSSRSWARRARASRRSCTSSPRSTSRRAARSRSPARTSARSPTAT